MTIKIHTGNCSTCDRPLFLEFHLDSRKESYVLQNREFLGEPGEIIYTCKCRKAKK